MTGGYEIAERMHEVLGKPQRVEVVPEDQLSPETRQIAMDLRIAFGIPEDGVIPEMLRLMLRHPELFKAQIAMGTMLAGHCAIPVRERELAILRNGWLCGAPYEWGEHVDIAQRYGVTREEIARCREGSAAAGWSEHERAIMRGVEELHERCMISDATWDTLALTWDEKQLMEFPVLVGQYVSTAMQQNSLRARLETDNPGLSYD